VPELLFAQTGHLPSDPLCSFADNLLSSVHLAPVERATDTSLDGKIQLLEQLFVAVNSGDQAQLDQALSAVASHDSAKDASSTTKVNHKITTVRASGT
jgi:hypothetical protein